MKSSFQCGSLTALFWSRPFSSSGRALSQSPRTTLAPPSMHSADQWAS